MDNSHRDWQWEEGSDLIRMSPYTSAGDMFKAVCTEIGRYYADKEGFKSFKKKVKWKGTYLGCDMCFWSSHSNISGEYVALEIVTHVHANKKEDNEKLEFVKSIDTPMGFREFMEHNYTDEAYKAHNLLVFNEYRPILIRE